MKGAPMVSVSAQSPREKVPQEYQYGILPQVVVCTFEFIEAPANSIARETIYPITILQEDSVCLTSPKS